MLIICEILLQSLTCTPYSFFLLHDVIKKKVCILLFKQLIMEFVEKENIQFDGLQSAEILLARDTRPSGEYLLKAAKQVSFLLMTINL